MPWRQNHHDAIRILTNKKRVPEWAHDVGAKPECHPSIIIMVDQRKRQLSYPNPELLPEGLIIPTLMRQEQDFNLFRDWNKSLLNEAVQKW